MSGIVRQQLFACLWSPACQTEKTLKKRMMEKPSVSLAAGIWIHNALSVH